MSEVVEAQVGPACGLSDLSVRLVTRRSPHLAALGRRKQESVGARSGVMGEVVLDDRKEVRGIDTSRTPAAVLGGPTSGWPSIQVTFRGCELCVVQVEVPAPQLGDLAMAQRAPCPQEYGELKPVRHRGGQGRQLLWRSGLDLLHPARGARAANLNGVGADELVSATSAGPEVETACGKRARISRRRSSTICEPDRQLHRRTPRRARGRADLQHPHRG